MKETILEWAWNAEQKQRNPVSMQSTSEGKDFEARISQAVFSALPPCGLNFSIVLAILVRNHRLRTLATLFFPNM